MTPVSPVSPEQCWGLLTGPGAEDPWLRQQWLSLWVAASNAGGAIDFAGPVTSAQVAPVLDAALAPIRAGRDLLITVTVPPPPPPHDDTGCEDTGRDDTGLVDPAGPRLVATAVLAGNGSPLQQHWRTVTRVMVHSTWQGRGLGRQVMARADDVAADLGLGQLRLGARSGLGLEDFYRRCGYVEIGRHVAAIRLGPGQDRDEILLVRTLPAAPYPGRGATLGSGEIGSPHARAH